MDAAVFSRLRDLCGSFASTYKGFFQNNGGALCQVWFPHAPGFLTTEGSPYLLMGASDDLLRYRLMSGQHKPSSDGSDSSCSVSRVFAGLQPLLAPDKNGSSNSHSPGTGFSRQYAALLCKVHSTVLLPVYDLLTNDFCPMAVFELAQHEVGVDMTTAVRCLAQAAQAVGFFIPTLDTAHSVAACEVPLTAMQDGQGSNDSTAAAAAAEGTAAGAAEYRRSRQSKGVRRSSCLIVEPTAQHGPADTAAGAAAAGAGQMQAAAGGNRRPRRASVIVTDVYTLGAASSFQHASVTHTAAANTQSPGVEAEHEESAREQQPVLVQPQAQPEPQLSGTATADSINNAGSSCAVASRKSPAVSGFAQHAQDAFPSPVVEQSVSYIQAPPLSHTLQQRPAQLSQQSVSELLLQQQQQQQRLVQQQHSSSFGLQQQHLQRQASSQAAAAAASKPQDAVLQDLRQQLSMLLERNEKNMRSTARGQQPLPSASFTMPARPGSPPPAARHASMQPMLRHQLSDEGNSFGPTPTYGLMGSAFPHPSCGTVRALVTHGGSLKRDSSGGSVEYVGGEQRLIVLNRACSARELREQLSGLGGGCLLESKIKFALPGAMGTLVSIDGDEDVRLMWEEWDEYAATNGKSGTKLQLFVGSNTYSYPSSERGSGGSSNSGQRSLGQAPSSQFQPSTPTVGATGSSLLCEGAAAAAENSGSLVSGAAASASSNSSATAAGPVGTIGSRHVGELSLPRRISSSSSPSCRTDSPQPATTATPRLVARGGISTADPVAAGSGGSALCVTGGNTSARGPPVRTNSQSRGVLQPVQQGLQALMAELHGKIEVMLPEELDVVRFLGGGAFGEVYLARWHGTEVAVKCLSPSALTTSHCSSGRGSDQAAAELLKEAATLASLHHPNLVTCFGVILPPAEDEGGAAEVSSRSSSCSSSFTQCGADFSERDTAAAVWGGAGSQQPTASSRASGRGLQLSNSFSGAGPVHPSAPAIVTEYMSAGSLRQAISNKAEWLNSNLAKAKLLLDTAKGITYLHNRQIVHFDLKSANLLVTVRDKVPCIKIADMGLAKAKTQTYVTGVDSLRGTLPWTAPEILKHPSNVTEAADCYSFGVIMWELWTGEEPHEGEPLHALLHQIMSDSGLTLPIPGTPAWGDAEAPPEPAPGWSDLMQRCWLPPQQRPTARQLITLVEDMMGRLRALRRTSSAATSTQGR